MYAATVILVREDQNIDMGKVQPRKEASVEIEINGRGVRRGLHCRRNASLLSREREDV